MPSEGTGGCSVISAAKEGCVVDASEETSCELGDSGVAGMVGPWAARSDVVNGLEKAKLHGSKSVWNPLNTLRNALERPETGVFPMNGVKPFFSSKERPGRCCGRVTGRETSQTSL